MRTWKSSGSQNIEVERTHSPQLPTHFMIFTNNTPEEGRKLTFTECMCLAFHWSLKISVPILLLTQASTCNPHAAEEADVHTLTSPEIAPSYV